MNPIKLTDLDELSLMVRDRESSLYIGEAINAYRGGAFRASIISTWISVVTDIISKIRELAAQGNANAIAQITLIDTAIQNNNVPQLQKIENELLEKSRNDFEFLSQQEFTDLERLKQDRNFCAHPAFVTEGLLFQPQPEMVRAHIVHAILHLLQHKPVQGKSALNRIKSDIVRVSFPSDQENVNKLLGAKYLNRAKDSFIKNLVIVLLKSYLRGDDADLTGKEQALIHCLSSVAHYHLPVYEEILREKLIGIIDALDDDQLAKIFKLIGIDNRYWDLLDESSRIRIQTLLSNLNLTDLLEFDAFDAMDVPSFKDVLTEKFESLDALEKEQIVTSSPRLQFADLAVSLYCSAGNFRSAERLGRNVLLPMSNYFNSEQILKILDSVSINDQINSASDTPNILVKLLEKTRQHLNKTKQGWLDFVGTLSNDPEMYYSYPKLREKLVEYDILTTAYPETDLS